MSGEDETAKTFTQDEVNEIVQKRLDEARKSYERAEKKRIEEAEEQARIAKLEGEEKIKAQHKSEIAKMEKERDDYRRNLAIANARASLSKAGLDPEFAESVLGDSDEKTEANIASLSKMVEEQVAKKVQSSYHGGAPPAPPEGGNAGDDMLEEYDYLRSVVGLKK